MNSSEVLIPLTVMLLMATIVAIGALFAGSFLGPKVKNKVKAGTYECGVDPTGNARDRVSVKYYLVAILFLLFDLEAAFLIPVALSWKHISLAGYVALALMGFFMVFFVVGLWYEFKSKALDWE